MNQEKLTYRKFQFLFQISHFTLPTLPELRKLLILLVVHQGGLVKFDDL